MSIGFITISMWIGMSAFGFVISIWNCRAAYGDWRYQIGKSERRQLIAGVNLENEIMRAIVHALLCIAGILVAWMQFNADPPPVSLIVRSIILATIAALVSQTLVHRWLRHRLKKTR